MAAAYSIKVGTGRGGAETLSKASEHPVIAAADGLQTRLTTAFLRLLEVVQAGVSLKDLQAALETGSFTNVMQVLDLDDRFQKTARGAGLQPNENSLLEVLKDVWAAGARAELEALNRVEVQKSNPCHEPAGSPKGGQFCGTDRSRSRARAARLDYHTALSFGFREEIAAARREAATQRGNVKPRNAATIGTAFAPGMVDNLPKEVLDTPIRFVSRSGGEPFQGFSTGVHPQYGRVILMNPVQQEQNYVPRLLHEVQHVVDVYSGRGASSTRGLSNTEYQRLHSEQRARRAELTGRISKGIEITLELAKAKIGAALAFDLLSPEAIAFLSAYTFDLIRGLSLETRLAVGEVILEAFRSGGHPYEQARTIRNMIGLTPVQAKAVSNFRRMLEGGPLDLQQALSRELRDHRFDATLRAAIRDAAPLPKDRIDAMVRRYYERALKYRAEMIARTETIRASHAGQMETWRQAISQGLLQANRKRKWIVTRDDRLCVHCRSIPRLNPGGVEMGEPFQSDLGPTHGPPLHPHCRCTTVLKVEW